MHRDLAHRPAVVVAAVVVAAVAGGEHGQQHSRRRLSAPRSRTSPGGGGGGGGGGGRGGGGGGRRWRAANTVSSILAVAETCPSTDGGGDEASISMRSDLAHCRQSRSSFRTCRSSDGGGGVAFVVPSVSFVWQWVASFVVLVLRSLFVVRSSQCKSDITKVAIFAFFSTLTRGKHKLLRRQFSDTSCTPVGARQLSSRVAMQCYACTPAVPTWKEPAHLSPFAARLLRFVLEFVHKFGIRTRNTTVLGAS